MLRRINHLDARQCVALPTKSPGSATIFFGKVVHDDPCGAPMVRKGAWGDCRETRGLSNHDTSPLQWHQRIIQW